MKDILPVWILVFISTLNGLWSSPLYPYESESREVRSLDGLWKFRTSPLKNQEAGFEKFWYKNDLEKVSFACVSVACLFQPCHIILTSHIDCLERPM